MKSPLFLAVGVLWFCSAGYLAFSLGFLIVSFRWAPFFFAALIFGLISVFALSFARS